MRALTLLLALVAGAQVTACASSPPAPGYDQPLTLEVQSAHYNDATIYAMLDGHWVRLGTVTGLTSEKLKIPPDVWTRAPGFRLLVDPLATSSAYLSETILAGPDDVVVLQVASVLSLSSCWLRPADDQSTIPY